MATLPGFHKAVDTIELSDAFRRHAEGIEKKPEIPALVESIRDFIGNLTHYRPEYGDIPFNRAVIKSLRDRMEGIAELAERLGCDEVVLPIHRDRRNLAAELLRKEVLKGLDLSVKVSFQQKPYNKDLSSLGDIDKEIRTVLDEGYRGFAEFNNVHLPT